MKKTENLKGQIRILTREIEAWNCFSGELDSVRYFYNVRLAYRLNDHNFNYAFWCHWVLCHYAFKKKQLVDPIEGFNLFMEKSKE